MITSPAERLRSDAVRLVLDSRGWACASASPDIHIVMRGHAEVRRSAVEWVVSRVTRRRVNSGKSDYVCMYLWIKIYTAQNELWEIWLSMYEWMYESRFTRRKMNFGRSDYVSMYEWMWNQDLRGAKWTWRWTMYACMYVCMYVCMWAYVWVHVYECVDPETNLTLRVCVCVFIPKEINISMCLHVSACVCMCLHVYVHVFPRNLIWICR
jgi:hypothetical protein